MIVCADDYGFTEDINRAILELAGSRRLSAVSVMVLLERCDRPAIARLLELSPSLDIGLHLCLTDEQLALSAGAPLGGAETTLPAFSTLLRRSLTRALNGAALEQAIRLQYDLFVQKSGRAPDFIDGHLHVHQLPVIRQALVRFVLSLPVAARPYIRNTFLPGRELRRRSLPWAKAAWIGLFGERMASLLRETGIRTNSGFAGIYDFQKAEHYAAWLPGFVDSLAERNGMLVVHPGTGDRWRAQETQALRDFAFPPGNPARFQPNATIVTPKLAPAPSA